MALNRDARFNIYVVYHGAKYGLLFEDKAKPDFNNNRAYFYLIGKEALGLEPTSEIIDICGTDCYPVESNETNRPIFYIIRNFAEKCEGYGTLGKTIPYDWVYHEEGNIYSKHLSRFFATSESLSDFIETHTVFTHQVLSRKGDKTVTCQANFIHLCKPEHLPFKPKYFTPIHNLLKIGKDIKATMFRPGGPLACDIDQDMVVWDKDLIEQIKNQLLDNFMILIQGKPGSGKSVLARILGYDLYNNNDDRIYYFSFKETKHFDIFSLAEILNGLKGIVILDDIHLEIKDVILLFSGLLKMDVHKHIMLVSRTVSRNNILFNTNALPDCPTYEIEPSNEITENIINKFSSLHSYISFSEDKIKYVTENFGNDYWFLAYSLMGSEANNGEGAPCHWPKEGVKKELISLKDCESNGLSENYPKVLVALSPLFRNEVPTSKEYLVHKLKISETDLAALIIHGNIYEINIYGKIYYSLPHSSIAELYWRYGKEYWAPEAPRYEDFIYDYASFNTTNGLEAIYKTDEEVAYQIYKRLRDADELSNVIHREHSLKIIGSWITKTGHLELLKNRNILNILAKKIDKANDMRIALGCIRNTYNHGYKEARKLWRLINWNRLTENILHKLSIKEIMVHASMFSSMDCKAARKLIRLLQFDKVILRWKNSETVFEIACELSMLSNIDPKFVYALWKCIHISFVSRINSANDKYPIFWAFGHIVKMKRKVRNQFCSLINLNNIVIVLSENKEYIDLAKCFLYMFNIDYRTGKTFWCMHKKYLAKAISSLNSIRDITDFINSLRSINKEIAIELCSLLLLYEIETRLDNSQYLYEIGSFFQIILETNQDAGRKLWANWGKHALPSRLCNPIDLWQEASCLRSISYGDPKVGQELCKSLDLKLLTKNLIRADEIIHIGRYISDIVKTNNDIGWKVWLDMKQDLLKRLCSTTDTREMNIFIDKINDGSAAMACEILDILNNTNHQK